MQLPRIGIDSNCLSYLIDAASGEKGAATTILEEGIALVRIWFYSTERFNVTATVAAECSQIKNPTKMRSMLHSLHKATGEFSSGMLKPHASAQTHLHICTVGEVTV